MKLAITGSRTFNDALLLADTVAKLRPSEIITSECSGCDNMAVKYAKAHGIPVAVIPPLFKTDKNIKYHPRYYHIRNRQIVDLADHVLAFWNGSSRGTKSTMDYARKLGKPLTVIRQTIPQT